MAELNVGKLTQIVSAVIDIKFPEGKLPEINEAINVPLKDGGKLVVEVAQHLGDDTVRCIAMGPTERFGSRYGSTCNGRTDFCTGRRSYIGTYL